MGRGSCGRLNISFENSLKRDSYPDLILRNTRKSKLTFCRCSVSDRLLFIVTIKITLGSFNWQRRVYR